MSMMPYFVWQDRSSLDFGLWVAQLPPITKPRERYKAIAVPGRSGHLTLLEDEVVHDSYVKKCVIVAPYYVDLQRVTSWLRGSGRVTFSNERDKAYDAEILDAVEFSREGNSMKSATVSFLVQPYKRVRDPAPIVFTGNGTIYNPGDVPSKPIVTIQRTGTGNTQVSLGGKMMVFTFTSSNNGTIVVDCDAQIITRNGAIWNGTFSGDFWRLPTGLSMVSIGNAQKIMIEPNWGWL